MNILKITLIAVILILPVLVLAQEAETPPDPSESQNADSLSPDSSQGAGYVYPLSPERKELLISYSRFKNIWRFARFGIGVVILLVVLYTGLSARFRNWAESVFKKKFFIYLFYFLLLTVFLFVVNLPFDYYRGFLIEHEYGFSNQSSGEWLLDSLKWEVVTFIFSFIVILFFFWLINRFRRWWLYLSLGAIPFLIFIMLIYPVVITPLFNKFEPLKDKYLASEMTALAERAGIDDPDIFEVDASKRSEKLNAYFVGLLGTKRIVLYDTIIKNFTTEELKFVMAHEIGHYLMNHIWYGILIAFVMILISVWLLDKILPGIIRRHSRRLGFSRLGDIAALPMIFLFVTVFSFVTQPATNLASRVMEYDADRFGMELSGVTDETAETAFDKLSAANLSDPDPSPIIEYWFYDHPSGKKRIAAVKRIYRELHE